MKKIVLSLVFAFILFQAPSFAEEFFGIGAELAQDAYNKKIIVSGLIENKPAVKSGIKLGDEIIAVDGKRITKEPVFDVVSKIRGNGEEEVKIRIKRNFFIRKTITMKRELVSSNCNCKPYIDYWMQIAQDGFVNLKSFDKKVLKKFSKKYALQLNYWFKRQQSFEIGYNACMNYSFGNREVCLIHLLDRESAKTNTDKTLYKFLKD